MRVISSYVGSIKKREGADYSNATINQIWGVKRPDHISGLLQIIKDLLAHLKALLFVFVKILY